MQCGARWQCRPAAALLTWVVCKGALLTPGTRRLHTATQGVAGSRKSEACLTPGQITHSHLTGRAVCPRICNTQTLHVPQQGATSCCLPLLISLQTAPRLVSYLSKPRVPLFWQGRGQPCSRGGDAAGPPLQGGHKGRSSNHACRHNKKGALQTPTQHTASSTVWPLSPLLICCCFNTNSSAVAAAVKQAASPSELVSCTASG